MIISEKKQLSSNEALFVKAYELAFPKVASFVKKFGGSFEEAKDIFQDALVIYYEKKLLNGLAAEANEVQYITGIARFLWYKKYRETKNNRSLELLPDLRETEDEPKVAGKILLYIEASGKKCLELLKSFYYDKLNMNEISEKFGFSGERSATTQKYKCLEKVRTAIKEKSLTKEDFYE